MAAETSEAAVAAAFREAMKPVDDAEAAPQDTAEVEAPVEVEAEQVDETTADAPAAEQDDVTSLRQRLADREAEVKRYEEQLSAVTTRNRQSLDTLNRTRMQYASQRDRARQLLEKAMSPDGVDKSEAERLLADIRGGYNPNSANYEPVQQQQIAQQAPQSDDSSIAINEWLNDNGLTESEAASFDTWIRTKAQLTERERRLTDPYTLLTSIAPRWKEAAQSESVVIAEKSDSARAAKTVARVQKQAAKAVSASIGSPNVGQSPPAGRKPEKPTDEQLGAAFRQSWEDSR